EGWSAPEQCTAELGCPRLWGPEGPISEQKVARQRPYCVEYTGSHPNSEVKRRKARIVLGWGTAREVLRLNNEQQCKPNYTKIRREEPPSMAAAFESHYPSVDEAGLRLWEGHMEWVSPSSPDAVFVKCAVICKGGADARRESVRLSDPAVRIRVVEDCKENGDTIMV
ncbi:hypothetical protein FOZ63_027957, partial [Perkinsus olseni]